MRKVNIEIKVNVTLNVEDDIKISEIMDDITIDGRGDCDGYDIEDYDISDWNVTDSH